MAAKSSEEYLAWLYVWSKILLLGSRYYQTTDAQLLAIGQPASQWPDISELLKAWRYNTIRFLM